MSICFIGVKPSNGVKEMTPTQESLEKVNRFEVIDHTADGAGRAFVKWKDKLTITFDFQDDGRTLKVFIND